MKIKNKKFMEGNYYIDKDSMLEILKKSKSVKAHQYREYILSNEQKIEEIIVDEKITCIYNNKHKTSKEEIKDKIDKRQFVDFGLNEIIYSDSKILFFEFTPLKI